MNRNFSSFNDRVTFALLAFAASTAAVTATAQTAVQYKSPSPNGQLSVPSKLPPQLLPDLKIDLVTGSSAKAYAAKIVNVGAIPSAASNVYCAATVSNATQWYTIEQVQPLPALNVNAAHSVTCDFGAGAQSVKPGEKLQSVKFVVNNGKVIKESSYANNELKTDVK